MLRPNLVTAIDRGRQTLALLLTAALLAQLTLPISVAWAESEGAVGGADTFNFSDVTTSLSELAASSDARAALNGRTAPISNAGAFEHSVTFELPQGRSGMTPSLGLSYDSDGRTSFSAVGAGWSFGVPRISRSTRYGFPKVAPVGEAVRYDEGGIYDGPSGELVAGTVEDGFLPSSENSRLYLPRKEQSPTRYEYIVEEDRWVEHLPSGTKRYYGRAAEKMTGQSARIVNELGTHAWLLVEEADLMGNVIEYRYHHDEEEHRGATNRERLNAPQSAPVLAEVRWGANRKSGQPHVYRAAVSVRSVDGPVNMLAGHQKFASIVERIDVFGPENPVAGQNEPGEETLYWSYDLDVSSSSDTGRPLLRSVSRVGADGTDPEVTEFSYSNNDDAQTIWESRTREIDLPQEVLAQYEKGPLGYFYPPNRDSNEALTPPWRRSGYQFTDFDGDGDVDVLYHPAGLKTPAARVAGEHSFLQQDDGSWQRMGRDGTSFRSSLLVRDIADVDGDRRPDALSWGLAVFLNREGESTWRYNINDEFIQPSAEGFLCERRGQDQYQSVGIPHIIDGTARACPDPLPFDPIVDPGAPRPDVPNRPTLPTGPTLGGGTGGTPPQRPGIPDIRPGVARPEMPGLRPTPETRPLPFDQTFSTRDPLRAYKPDGQTASALLAEPVVGRELSSANGHGRVKSGALARLSPADLRRSVTADVGLQNRLRPTVADAIREAAVNNPKASDRFEHADSNLADRFSEFNWAERPFDAERNRSGVNLKPEDEIRIKKYLCENFCRSPGFLSYCESAAQGISPALPATFMQSATQVPGVGHDVYPSSADMAYHVSQYEQHALNMSSPELEPLRGANIPSDLMCSRPQMPAICGMAAAYCAKPSVCDGVGIGSGFSLATMHVIVDKADGDAAPMRIEGWPRSVRQAAEIAPRCATDELDKTRLEARMVNDFHAPMVDVNADGKSDIVLLKARMPQTRHGILGFELARELGLRTAFVPYTYLSDGEAFTIDGLPNLSLFEQGDVTRQNATDFTGSLAAIFGAEPDFQCFLEDPARCNARLRFPTFTNFNAMLMDVNGDGLVDIVGARSPMRVGNSPKRTCVPGHDVFLNRGWRWDASPAESLATDPTAKWSSGNPLLLSGQDRHPLGLIANRDGYCTQFAPLDFNDHDGGSTVPPSAMTLVDVNADGRTDILVAADGGNAKIRRLFLNTGRGYRRATVRTLGASEAMIPADVRTAIITNTEMGQTKAVDLIRFVDIDSDGLVDILYPGICQGGAEDHQRCRKVRWRRNLRQVPDLLTSVTEHGGGHTSVQYKAASHRAARATTYGWLPTVRRPGEMPVGKMVVARISRRAAPLIDGRLAPKWQKWGFGAREVIDLSYDNFSREHGSPNALGFEIVNARFQSFDAQGARAATLTSESIFDVAAEHEGIEGEPVDVAYPLGGALVRHTLTSGETSITTEPKYRLSQLSEQVVRIRPAGQRETHCTDGQCVAFGTDNKEFDALGYAQHVLSGRVQDDAVVEDGLSTLETTSFIHRTTTWAIGLPSETRVYGKRDTLHASEHRGLLFRSRVSYSEAGLVTATTEFVADKGCGEVDARHLQQITRRTPDGLPSEITVDKGRRVVSLEYDRRHLYLTKATVRTPSNKDIPDLSERYASDYRFGTTSWREEANGFARSESRDSRGRVLQSVGPTGDVASVRIYHEPVDAPHYVDVETFSQPGASFISRTYFDGHGNAMGAVREEPGYGRTPTRFVRIQRTVHDAWGNATASALPFDISSLSDEAVTSMEGAVSRTSHDGFGRVLQQVDPSGRTTSWSYAVDGSLGQHLVTETNPRGFESVRRYDARSALIQLERYGAQRDALAVHTYARDGFGRITSILDADGLSRELEYGLNGKLRRVTLPHEKGAELATFSYCYDVEGALVTSTTPSERTTTIVRDELGRSVATTTEHAGELITRTFVYDEPGRNGLGRLTSHIDESGTWSHGYDEAGRQNWTNYVPSSDVGALLPSGSGQGVDVYQSYSLTGEVTAVEFSGLAPSISLDFGADALGRVRTVDLEDAEDQRRLVQSTEYDVYSGLSDVTLGNGVAVTVERDLASQLVTGLSHVAQGQELSRSSYPLSEYDANRNPTFEEHFVRGALHSRSSYAFDALDRLTNASLQVGEDGWNEAFTYSPGGRMDTATVDGETTIYSYDDRANAQAVTGTYENDRLSREIGYDADGWVKADENFGAGRIETRAIEYDAAGCMRRVESVLRDETARTQVTEHFCGLGGERVARRTTRGDKVDTLISLPGGFDVRPEQDLVEMRLELGGGTHVELAWSLATGEMQLEESGYVHTDLRGSVLAKTRFDAPLEQPFALAAYGPWGRTISSPNAELPRYQFIGHEPDPGDGYYHFGQRVYDPELRRWLSPDPMVLGAPEAEADWGSQLDLYSYSANNPIAYQDRSGNFIEIISDLASVAAGVASIASWDENTSTLDKVLDVGGLVIDTAAAVVPVVPGGVGLGLRAARTADRLNDARKAADRAQDAARASSRASRRASRRGSQRARQGDARPSRRTSEQGGCSGSSCGTTGCFVAGTGIAAIDGQVAIESVDVGDKVRSASAGVCEQGPSFAEHVVLDLELPVDGTTLEVRWARPADWVLEHVAEGVVWLELKELGFSGAAQVLGQSPLETAQGPGCVVTATVAHTNHDVYRLQLGDRAEALYVTGSHPLFSEESGDWVQVRELSAGDWIRSELGPVRVGTLEQVQGGHRVFNFEVASQHSYLAGDSLLWAHNTNPSGKNCGAEQGGSGEAESGSSTSLPARPGQRVPPPRTLEAFPGATRAKPKTSVQGGGGLRRRWTDKKGNIYEWDSQHGTVEKYNKRGRHQGEFDAQTGKQVKQADPNRTVDP